MVIFYPINGLVILVLIILAFGVLDRIWEFLCDIAPTVFCIALTGLIIYMWFFMIHHMLKRLDSLDTKKENSITFTGIILLIIGAASSVYLNYRLIFDGEGAWFIVLISFWLVMFCILGIIVLLAKFAKKLVSKIILYTILFICTVLPLFWTIGYSSVYHARIAYSNIAYYEISDKIYGQYHYVYSDAKWNTKYEYDEPDDDITVLGSFSIGDKLTPLLEEEPVTHDARIWYPVLLDNGRTGYLYDYDDTYIDIYYNYASEKALTLVKDDVESHWYHFLPDPILSFSELVFQTCPLWFGFSMEFFVE